MATSQLGILSNHRPLVLGLLKQNFVLRKKKTKTKRGASRPPLTNPLLCKGDGGLRLKKHEAMEEGCWCCQR